MNKFINLLLIIIFLSGCSFNKSSKFWTSDTLEELGEEKFQKIFNDKKTLSQEFNTNINLNLGSNFTKTTISNKLTNNDGRVDFNGLLKRSSKYKFSKIKNIYQFEPVISFNNNNIIFFDNKFIIFTRIVFFFSFNFNNCIR